LYSFSEQGHLVADENADTAQCVERMEKILKMRKTLPAFTDKQYTVLIAYRICVTHLRRGHYLRNEY